MKITVPYACETRLSGLEDKGFRKTFWYHRSFDLPESMVKKILPYSVAVDYQCDVWISSRYIRNHTGGIFPKMWAKKALGVPYNSVQYDYVGLNYLSFTSNITIDGR